MKVILQEPFNFTLYEDGEQLILEVLCGTVAMYDIQYLLSPSEQKLYWSEGISYIRKLAGNIQRNPSQFKK